MHLLKKTRTVLLGATILAGLLLPACNYDYYLANQYRAKKNYELANVHYHRAMTKEPDDRDFRKGYLNNSVDVSAVLIERYFRFIEEKKFLPAYFLLQRAKELNVEADAAKIKEESDKWLKILIAGKLNFNFERLPNYSGGASKFKVMARFNTPNAGLLNALVDPLTGVYFVEDYLYSPPQEYLMFYTLNSVGVNTETSIDALSEKINVVVESTTGTKERQQTKIRASGNQLTSEEFLSFISFSVPVLTEAKGELELSNEKSRLREALSSLPTKQGKLWSPEPGVRFSAFLDKDKILINTTTPDTDFVPLYLFSNSDTKRSFLDFGEKNLILDKNINLWRVETVNSEGLGYREKLLNNKMLLSYLNSFDGAYPFIQN